MYTLLSPGAIGEPSVSKLIRKLREMGTEVTKVLNYDSSVDDTDILIRWGQYGRFPLKEGAKAINTAKSIQLGSNKLLTRKTLQENNVSVAKSWFSIQDVLNDSNVRYPLIGRPETHTQGQNVEFINNEQELLRSTSAYWAEYIAKEKEYRVYVFGGKVLNVVEKIPQDSSAIAWNHALGATFNDLDYGQYPENILVEAIKAAKVVGQYFSGVDIMVKDGIPYILELNSSLALSNRHRVNVFAKAFKYVFDYFETYRQLPEIQNSQHYHPCLG